MVAPADRQQQRHVEPPPGEDPVAENQGMGRLPREVRLSRIQRDIGKLLLRDCETKEIAGSLEISMSTAYSHLAEMCSVVGVPTRGYLKTWILQHPGCLWPSVISVAGLHPTDGTCDCGAGHCLGVRQAIAPPE